MPKRKRKKSKKKGPSPAKARKILHDKSVKGHPLTPAQRRFMGARASGQPVKTRTKKKSKRNRKSETGSY